MKIWLIIFLILISICAKAPERDFAFESICKEKIIKEFKEKEFKRFVNDLFKSESSKDWYIINERGAMGGFQFLSSTLKELGYKLNPNQFRKNSWLFPPEYQKAFLNMKIKRDLKLLNPYIKKYNGKYIRGIEITVSGLIGAAHIAGVGNAKNKTGVIGWLLYGHNPHDGGKNKTGTYLTDYLIKFSNYKF